VLLCYLEGLTRDEAAGRLGWTPTVVRGRLDRARARLRDRLTRRGLTLSAVLLAALLTETAAEALPAALAARLVRPALAAAAGRALAAEVASARVVSLAQGVVNAMSLTKLRHVAALCLLGLLGLGAGAWALGGGGDDRPDPRPQAAAPAADTPDANADDELPPDDPALLRRQAESRMNLKRIAEAMHAYYARHNYLPPPAIYQMTDGRAGFTVLGPGAPGGMMPGMAPPGMGMGGAPAMAPGTGIPSFPMGPMGGSGGRRPRNGALPGVAAGPPPAKALLSWRVELLRYLGEEKLYHKFHPDEPWDSPHNKKLLAKMPKVYAPPGVKTKQPGLTYYQVFVGPHAGFEEHAALVMNSMFLDGTSNTFLVVEAGKPVPWTKPADLDYSPDKPLPPLGGIFSGVFNAAMADGTVYPLRSAGNPDEIRRGITRDDGRPFHRDELRAPVSRKEYEMRRRNRLIKDALAKEQARFDDLSREMQLLDEIGQDAETRRLRKENEQLEKTLRDLRDQTDKLKLELDRLKRGAGKR
jgi:hypothetical protein